MPSSTRRARRCARCRPGTDTASNHRPGPMTTCPGSACPSAPRTHRLLGRGRVDGQREGALGHPCPSRAPATRCAPSGRSCCWPGRPPSPRRKRRCRSLCAPRTTAADRSTPPTCRWWDAPRCRRPNRGDVGVASLLGQQNLVAGDGRCGNVEHHRGLVLAGKGVRKWIGREHAGDAPIRGDEGRTVLNNQADEALFGNAVVKYPSAPR